MTPDELLAGLMKFKSSTIVSFVSRTVPVMRKTDNPYFGRIIKETRVNGVIRWDYQTAVNKQRVRELKEPTFESEPRAWGERVPGTPLIQHKDLFYLEVKVERASSVYLTDDGSEVALDDLKPFLPKKGEGRQEVEKPVILRDYRLDHIIKIIWHGLEMDVSHTPT